jgi:hypothetical protein
MMLMTCDDVEHHHREYDVPSKVKLHPRENGHENTAKPLSTDEMLEMLRSQAQSGDLRP